MTAVVTLPEGDVAISEDASASTRQRRPRRRWTKLGGAVVIVGCLVFLAPVFVMLLTALQPNQDVVQYGPAAFPDQWTLTNFSQAWTQGSLSTYYLNSAMILLVKVPLGVLLASLAAYPLTTRRFFGRKALLVALLVGLGVPQVITWYPLLEITRHTGLQGSVWVLLLPYLAFGLPFEILVMRGAFAGRPNETLEAARVDGASEWRIWARVCMPMVLPALASLVVLDGVATWNEFVIALTLLNNQASDTLTIGVLNLQGLFGSNYAQLEAGIFVCVIPMVILFFVARRYLTRGIAVGAVKG